MVCNAIGDGKGYSDWTIRKNSALPESLQRLDARRRQILALSVPRDPRWGSIRETYCRCSKSSCWCSQSGQVGQRLFYPFTSKVEGKTQTLQLRSSPDLTKLQEQEPPVGFHP